MLYDASYDVGLMTGLLGALYGTCYLELVNVLCDRGRLLMLEGLSSHALGYLMGHAVRNLICSGALSY